MNRMDLTPFRRSTVGFDRVFDLMERQARNAGGDNYPPFNIERRGDDEYRITLAVAGFRKPDLDIVAQQNLLVVTGKKRDALQEVIAALKSAALGIPLQFENFRD